MVEHINTKYQPSNRDVVAVYHVVPVKGVTIYQAAELIASIPQTRSLRPVVFGIDRRASVIRVAFPLDLFELDNAAHLLDVLLCAGGAQKMESLRLIDVVIPPRMLVALGGPRFGVLGVRERLGVKRRPLVAMSLPRGLSLKQYESIAMDCWLGRADIVLDDPLVSSPALLDRMNVLSKAAAKASSQSGEVKSYMPSMVSSEGGMSKVFAVARVCRIVMGSTTQLLRIPVLRDAGLMVGSSIIPQVPISRSAMSTLCRAVGADMIRASDGALQKDWDSVKESMRWAPVSPVEVPQVLKVCGDDTVLVGSPIHPAGPAAAARAMRQAMEASLSHIPLVEYAKVHRELRQALGPAR